jgi:hypothetical protein
MAAYAGWLVWRRYGFTQKRLLGSLTRARTPRTHAII